MPTVQELVEQSFLTSNIKLKKVPPVLILQMPRFGKQFKVYDRIMPSQLIDVTDLIEDCKTSTNLFNVARSLSWAKKLESLIEQ